MLDEQSVKEIFAKLSRKSFEIGQKEKVWLVIQDYIRKQRLLGLEAKDLSRGWPVFSLGRLAWAAFVVVLALGVIGGATKASEGSLPGDRLYTVKKVAEGVERVLATSDQAKVKVGIKHAKRRLGEVKIMVAENKQTEMVTQTLEELKSTTEQVIVAAEAAEPKLRSEAVDLVTEETEVLTSVKEQAKQEVKEAVQDVLSASHESISKFEKDSEVEGVSTHDLQEQENTSAVSTSPTSTSKALPKPKIQDGVVESNIQIDIVIKLEKEGESSANGPEILQEPVSGF